MTRSLTFALLTAAAAIALTLPASRSEAACTPDPPSDNDAVSCDGTDSTGFDGSGATGLTITTNGAAELDESDALLDSAILVGDDNTITIGPGATVTVTEAGGFGLRGDDRNSVTNDGTIVVDGSGGVAIDMNDSVDGVGAPAIGNNGTITLNGDDAVGLRTNDNYAITNGTTGTINVVGDNGIAIQGVDDNFVINDGAIVIDGDNGRGIQIQRNTGLPLPNGAVSRGSITINGADGIAIQSGTNAGVAIQGTIDLNGDDNIGLAAGNKTDPNAEANITNQATINAAGTNAVGLLVGDGWANRSVDFPDDNATLNTGTINASGVGSIAIFAGNQANFFGSHNSFVENSSTGVISVTGMDAIGLSLGGNSRLFADGDTTDDRYTFENFGQLAGDADAGALIHFRNRSSGENRIVNRAGASILADLTNQGTANRALAINGTAGTERVDNFGTIQGDLMLGAGNDIYRHGDAASLTGRVLGGDGTDIGFLAPSTTALSTFDLSVLEEFEFLAIEGDDALDPGWQLQNTVGFTGLVEVLENGSLDATAPITLGGNFTNRGRTTGALTFGDTGVTAGNTGILDAQLDFGLADDVLVNTGTINQIANLGAGNDEYEHGVDATLNAPVDGGAGEDFVTLESSGNTRRTFDVSRLQNFERISLAGPGMAGVTQLGWELMNAGSFTGITEVLAGGVLNATANPVTLGGALELDPDATVRLATDGVNTPLTIGGATTFAGNLIVEASPALATNGTYRLIEVTGPLTPSTFASESLPAGLTRTSTVYDATGLSLVVFTSPDFEGIALGANRAAIGAHLDRLRADPTTPTLLADELERFATGTDELNPVFDALNPEPYDAQTTLIAESSRRIASLLMNRPRECKPGQADPWQGTTEVLACHARTWSPWLAGVGSFRKRDAFAGHPEYESTIGGLAFGVDVAPIGGLELTLAVTSQRGQIDVLGYGESDLVLADLSGHAAYTAGPLRLQSVVSWGYGSHNTRRQIRFEAGSGAYNASAEEDFASQHVAVSAQAGLLFGAGSIDLEPLVGVDYTWITQDEIRESQGGLFAGRVDERDDEILSVVAGLRASTVYHHTKYLHTSLLWMDGIWRPTLDLRWRQTLSGYDRTLSARLDNAPDTVSDFVIEGKEDKGGFEVGAGLSFVPDRANRLQFDLRYDAYRAAHTLEHDLVAKIRLGF